jgi:hypothetical protein
VHSPSSIARSRLSRWLRVGSVVLVATLSAVAAEVSAPRFAEMVERLSEPGGDFGGDNLISNEQSYLHVMPALAAGKVSGGAYVGVGPDQNFSYMAQIKPEVAYLIDIRRDNLLLLLLFKALFAEAPTRVEYLCLLTGRPAPKDAASWSKAGIDKIIAYVDQAKPGDAAEQEKTQRRIEAVIRRFGVPLTNLDIVTIAKCRREFVAEGLSLVFQARGQPRRSYYPTLRTLLRENDRAGHQLSFLASEPAFQFVRDLQARDRVIPVVGDVSAAKAMRAIAADIAARNLRVSGFYISNVEYYLYQDNSFGRYAENLKAFPVDARSMIIRSVFPSGGSRNLPQALPGIYSVSLTQPFETMLRDLGAGKYGTYRDLVEATARAR